MEYKLESMLSLGNKHDPMFMVTLLQYKRLANSLPMTFYYWYPGFRVDTYDIYKGALYIDFQYRKLGESINILSYS